MGHHLASPASRLMRIASVHGLFISSLTLHLGALTMNCGFVVHLCKESSVTHLDPRDGRLIVAGLGCCLLFVFQMIEAKQ